MSRVVHFEIHADNPERASGFYTRVFGWTISLWGGATEYWMVQTGEPTAPGINGGLLKRIGPPPVEGQPVNSHVNTVNVADLEATLTAVKQHGGRQVVDKQAIPGVGWFAYCKDTEGNIFGIMQNDPGAK